MIVAGAAGCLAAPPEAIDPGTGDDGSAASDGRPGAACDPFLDDGFSDDTASRTIFAVDEQPPDSTVEIVEGLARLGALGSADVAGYASLRSLSTHEVDGTALEVVLDSSSVNAGGGIILALDTDGPVTYELGALGDRFVVSHSDSDTTTLECDPCADFTEGSWILRLEDREGTLHFLAGRGADPPADLWPGGVAIENRQMYAQIFVLAPADGDVATADIDRLSWSVCQ